MIVSFINTPRGPLISSVTVHIYARSRLLVVQPFQSKSSIFERQLKTRKQFTILLQHVPLNDCSNERFGRSKTNEFRRMLGPSGYGVYDRT
jgi:hypothetical protein